MLPLKALQEAVAGWRKTRHPRFAAVAQWATTRALAEAPPREVVGKGWKKSDVEAWNALFEERDLLDLPRLFAAVGGGRSAPDIDRLIRLAKLEDPRVTDGVLGLLENPPYRANTAFPFFRACMKALEGQGDLRVRPALEELASRYKSILETSVGDDVSALLRRTAGSLDQVKPGPLPAAQEKKCAALEALFEVDQTQSKRGASRQRSAQANDEALLAAVYAAPDDDTPRLVFADALTERGDPRGEFIALQLARAKGQATPAQLARERELSVDAKKRVAWGLPLTQGGGCHLARGFPDEFIAEPRMFKTVVGLPAVRTLHKVSGLERQISVKQARAFLLHEGASGLVQVEGITRELFEGLGVPLPWRKLGLHFLPMREEFDRMPQARSLTFSYFQDPLNAQSFAGLERIERLSIGRAEGSALAPLVGLIELHLSGFMQDFAWAKELAPLVKLKRLDTGSGPTAAQLEGMGLEALSCHFTPQLDADALISALPRLQELRVMASGGTELKAVAKVLTAKRLGQLRLAAVGSYHFVSPFTPEGRLELRSWSRSDYEIHAQTMPLLPEGCVSKVIIRPRDDDPWSYAGPPPAEAAQQAIRAAARVPVELAWY